MKQFPSEKYNIAWFKLAEFVGRGEKERALGIYRLLAHSLDDNALTAQLQGDLLLSFEDSEAISWYERAAQLYKESGRLIESAAVYEHLCVLKCDEANYYIELIEIYKQKCLLDSAYAIMHNLFELWRCTECFEKCVDLLADMESLSISADLAEYYQKLIFSWVQQPNFSKEIVLSLAQKAIDGFTLSNNEKLLQRFLSTLETKNENFYKEVCFLIVNN
ncbi:MAG: hypothetical protein UR26_C0004G0054 [candidate division TM6 bacterium GW2011_GWF2_32_72]|nr:MAG: hypothetical protein UR26_C0004G0054 [candidate division TM6 bacterium GW2011_GWF2_32_72]